MPSYAEIFDTTENELDNIQRWVQDNYEYCGRNGHGWARYPTVESDAGTPVSGVPALFNKLWDLNAYYVGDPDQHDDDDPLIVTGGGVEHPCAGWWDLMIRWRILFGPQIEYRYCGTGNPREEPIYGTDGTAEAVLLPLEEAR